ncbi:hypothetical protein [Nannocystis punicea]|uniref:MYXO-CTERM domain-containing protein n=1 Tax=Nannocystis punicea TaxID=2995304 RepID=A0ABY7HIJ1_9BACT|nr:hypothetical protein [Nannocystis poenicansa]WAS98882.1 hypothetical protein O0S08_22355 [Nannocystis poenicansa]
MALNSSVQAMTLALAGAAVLLPGEAEACSPAECAYVDAWQSLQPINAQAIPIDGVLLLRGAQSGDSPEEEWLDKIELTVTLDGQPIAGAVEAAGIRDVLLWRPAAPLEPGEYQAVGSLDNPAYDFPFDYCSVDLTLDFGFTVVAEPSAPLVPPLVESSTMVIVRETETLTSLVCCEGAVPYSYSFDCGGGGEYVGWEDGFCAAHQGFGSLRVEVTVDTKLPPATSAMVKRELIIDGESQSAELLDAMAFGDSKPFCTTVLLTNLATGETATSEQTCHGSEPEIMAQLGDVAIDPGDELLENCSEPAYTCEVAASGDRWDLNKCAPWAPDEPTGGDPTEGPGSGGDDTGDGTDGPASGGQDGLVEHGCACDSRAPSPFGALLLLGLGLLRPRRRRSRWRYVPKDSS